MWQQNIKTHILLYKKHYLIFGGLFIVVSLFLFLIIISISTQQPSQSTQTVLLPTQAQVIRTTPTETPQPAESDMETLILQTEAGWAPYFNEEGEKTEQKLAERAEKYPFTKVLPQTFGNAILDYDVNDDETITYIVRPIFKKTYTRSSIEAAVTNFIQSQGFDPKTINLVWKQ